MSLKEKLLEDMKTAMREKDNLKKNAIQMVRAAVLQVEKDKKVSLDDDGIIEIIAKEVKKRRDSLPEYEKSGRQDLIDDLNSEIQILKQYLPEELSLEQLELIIKETITELGATSPKEFGKVFQAIKAKTIGVADGKVISELLKKILV